ncbi:SDR family oxidoreductase [Gluconacetobacter asukensis]|uniref:SDR family oxidoreductase n=2 Tax=Gluconacetobacter asukensis TaxID=1017181 RepID=A0A7W4IZ34_9PROT|nr:SDR family oxidoreductase [Gluconacetobacter asukensis]
MTSLTQSAAIACRPRDQGQRHRARTAPDAHAAGLDAAFAVAEGKGKGDKIRSVAASTPQKRFGEASDLLGAMLFLASDESAFVTGQTIDVDGGHRLMS